MPLRLFLAIVLAATSLVAAEAVAVSPVPAGIRQQFKLSLFYTKFVDVGGMPIVASEKVSDFALLEAHYLIERMTSYRPELLAVIAKNNVRFVVMAPDEFTTDIPEHSDLTPKDYWGWRAR